MPQDIHAGDQLRTRLRVPRGLIDPPPLVNNKQKSKNHGYRKDGFSRFSTMMAAAPHKKTGAASRIAFIKNPTSGKPEIGARIVSFNYPSN
jgi:hypothetical protein